MANSLRMALLMLAACLGLASCCVCVPRQASRERANEMIREDFVRAGESMKVAVMEYYSNMGKLPAKNSDAGLPEPDQYHGQSLRSATVRPDGVIELVFDGKAGKEGGRIRLVPDVSHPAMSVQWHCETADFPAIRQALPNCDYVSR